MKATTKWAIAVATLASIPLVTTTYQRVAERADMAEFPPPGRLVAVDGLQIHLHCRGAGSPTVIVEQGIGTHSLSWSNLSARLSGDSRVCTYDRPGLGYSEPAGGPTLARDVALRLSRVLQEAKIEDELILVGWSMGGLYVREFYRQYPERVRGIVLVDSVHEQQLSRMPFVERQPGYPDLFRFLAPVGFVRIGGFVERSYAASRLPEYEKRQRIAILERSHAFQALHDEGVAFDLDMSAGFKPPNLGDIPQAMIEKSEPATDRRLCRETATPNATNRPY